MTYRLLQIDLVWGSYGYLLDITQLYFLFHLFADNLATEKAFGWKSFMQHKLIILYLIASRSYPGHCARHSNPREHSGDIL